MAGGDFAHEVGKARCELIGDAAVLTRGGEHLRLQAPLAFRDINLLDEVFGRNLYADVDERGCEGCRPALIVFLRKKRHLGYLGAHRHTFGPRMAQSHSLRHH